jgi:uncharacterized protein (DUF1499 family)
MARFLYLFVIAIIVIAIALVIAGRLGMLRGNAPSDLGFKDGKLKEPSNTENSVTSQADLWPDHPLRAYASIAPFKLSGPDDAVMQRIASALQAQPRTIVISQTPDYIYAQSTTALMQFTDDVEFLRDSAAGVVHVRSASRIGRKDFGVNRERIEQIRQAIGQ